jgi:hypothetical protein
MVASFVSELSQYLGAGAVSVPAFRRGVDLRYAARSQQRADQVHHFAGAFAAGSQWPRSVRTRPLHEKDMENTASSELMPKEAPCAECLDSSWLGPGLRGFDARELDDYVLRVDDARCFDGTFR